MQLFALVVNRLWIWWKRFWYSNIQNGSDSKPDEYHIQLRAQAPPPKAMGRRFGMTR